MPIESFKNGVSRHTQIQFLTNLGGNVTPEGLKNVEPIPDWLEILSKTFNDTNITESEFKTNHYLINSYNDSVGIMPHTDGPLYHPYVTVISIGNPILFKIFKDMNAYAEEDELANIIVESGSLLIFTGSYYHDCLHAILDNAVETIRVDYTIEKDENDENAEIALKYSNSSINNLHQSSIYSKHLKSLEIKQYSNIEDLANLVDELDQNIPKFDFKVKISEDGQTASLYVSWRRDKRISLTIRHVKPAEN
jgi:alkylated DNA repair protein alkB family protein 6